MSLLTRTNQREMVKASIWISIRWTVWFNIITAMATKADSCFCRCPFDSGVLTGSSNNVVRYNISQNDLTHTFNFAGGVTPDTQIYNNTIYIGAGQNTKIIDHEWDDAGNINAPYSFRNNLVYNLGQGGYNLPGER